MQARSEPRVEILTTSSPVLALKAVRDQLFGTVSAPEGEKRARNSPAS